MSLLLASAMLMGRPAAALDKQLCARSYVAAQESRQKGALRQARRELQTCVQACASPVVDDCTRWLNEVEPTIPSVVVAVTRDGRDVTDAKIHVDGEQVTDLTRPVELDPGPHAIVVELGETRVEEKFLLREGERGRRVEVFLPTEAPFPPIRDERPAPRPTPPPMIPPIQPESTPDRLPAVAFGALGIAGLATFGACAILGESRYAEHERCAPFCDQSEVDTTKRIYLIGDIGLVVGAVSLGVATYFLLRPASQSTSYRGPLFRF